MTELKPADQFPEIPLQLLSGESVKVSDYLGTWVLFIVYRGYHCPRCKTYVKRLHSLEAAYRERGVEILLATTDPELLVRKMVEENDRTLPVAHSLSLDQCRQLSLYLTPHDANSEASGYYSEPGMFLINPKGETQVIERSNSPSVRPDLEVVLDGIIGTQERNLPIRGTYFG